MPKKLKIIDLFSGAGGLSLGFELTKKFEIVAAIDNWKPSIETFSFNHPNLSDEQIIHDDITNIFPTNSKKIISNKWLKEIDLDVLVGGPPCQGMSLAGKRLNDDPRNDLFKSFISAIQLLQPKYFLMENVPGLLSMQNGQIHNAIVNSIKGINYNLPITSQVSILKAECYGVPQIRRRVFYLGARKDIKNPFNFWPPVPSHQEFSRNKYKKGKADKQMQMDFGSSNDYLLNPISVKEAISDLPKLKSGEGSDEMSYGRKRKLTEYQISMRNWDECPRKNEKPILFNHEPPNHTKDMIKKIKKTKQGESVDPNYSDSRKWHPEYPGYTVKALGAGGGSTNRRAFHFDEDQPRASTVRENARIQSFPDWYKFIGSKTDQMSLVGNSVPPILAKEIAKFLHERIKSNKH